MPGRSQNYTVTDEKSSNLSELLVTPDDATVSTKKSTTRCITIFFIIFLTCFAVATSITVVALAITLGVRTAQLNDASSQSSGSTSDSDTCLTPGCIQLAAQVQASLNQSVDPCQDFYQFSCGNWVQNNIIPEGLPRYGVFAEEIQRNTVNVRVRKILESGNDGGVEAVGKALRLYQSCINDTHVNSLGAAPLLDVIRTQTGGWSLIGIPEEGPWSINSSYFFYQKAHGSDVFFLLAFNFNPVVMNNTYYVPVITEQVKFLVKSGEDVNKTRSSLVNTLMLLNASVNQSVYEEAVDKALDLDNTLKNMIVPRPADLVNNSRYQYTVEGLQSLFPEFNWQAFLTYIYNIGGLTVPNDVRASVITPAFFPKLYELFQNTTDKSVFRDYANLFFVKAVSQFLGGPFAAYRDPDPQVTQPGNSASCIRFVENVLPIALARPYVEQFVPDGTRENISMLADFLVKGFRERVRGMNWLSDFSKQATLEKVDTITSMVAYPADILNNDYVNGLYNTYTANASDFFGNKLRGMELTLRTLLGYTTGFDKRQWSIAQGAAPTTINAFFNQATIQFYVTVVDLVPPVFNADWPDYFNFGALGSVVGHEITHGFDSNGQMQDKDGIVRMWWSQQSQAEFNRRTQCFINQYNQYRYLGVQVNGMRSLPENLADNGGLQTSFQAYRMRVAESGKEPQRLPTLPYTPDQLFFIAFSQVWCEVATPFWYQYLADKDNHAPGVARVNTVINVKEFAEAFNCPVGTPMNPSNDKCLIW